MLGFEEQIYVIYLWTLANIGWQLGAFLERMGGND